MRLLKMAVFLTFLIFVSCSSNGNNKKFTLKLNLQTGKTYKLFSKNRQDIRQTVHHVKQTVKTNIKGILAFQVKERKNDDYIMNLKYEKLFLELASPRFTISYDSDKPYRPDNIFDRVYSQFINKNFTLQLDDYGTVKSVVGLDSLGKSIIQHLKLKNPMLQAKLIEDFKDIFGNKAFKTNLAMLTQFYPRHPVGVADSWHITIKSGASIPAVYETTYKLIAYDSLNAVIEGSTEIRPLSSKFASTLNGMSITYKIKGKGDSKIKIDPRSGWIKSVTGHSTAKGTMTIEKGKHFPNGLEIPFELHTQTEYSSF